MEENALVVFSGGECASGAASARVEVETLDAGEGAFRGKGERSRVFDPFEIVDIGGYEGSMADPVEIRLTAVDQAV
jgi:hypothetical protein